MRPLRRSPVSKRRSTRQFNRRADRTPAVNVSTRNPMRGGIRM